MVTLVRIYNYYCDDDKKNMSVFISVTAILVMMNQVMVATVKLSKWRLQRNKAENKTKSKETTKLCFTDYTERQHNNERLTPTKDITVVLRITDLLVYNITIVIYHIVFQWYVQPIHH